MILDFGDGLFLRHAMAEDHAALCRVCLQTGDAGEDATWREDDPELMGLIYAVPYQIYEPDLAFVLTGPEGVCGYLFGALDTGAFYTILASQWYPSLRKRIRDPGPEPSRWTGSDWVRHAIHEPALTVPPELASFPSHGHIDLLPPARGRGIGRRCMAHLEARLAAAGSTGLFLDVHPRNETAQRFYSKLGYDVVTGLPVTATSMFMAKRLGPPTAPS